MPTAFGPILDRSESTDREYILYKHEAVGPVFMSPLCLCDIGPSAGGVVQLKDWQHKVRQFAVNQSCMMIGKNERGNTGFNDQTCYRNIIN